MSKKKVTDIPGFGTGKPLREQVDEIVGNSSLSYEQKLETLTRIIPKHQAVRLIGPDPKEEITLRDPIAGCGKRLFLVMQKRYFDEVMAGTKKEEYRVISDSMPGRYTYKGKDGRRYLKPFDSIRFAVGYHSNREMADVEVTDIKTNGELVTFCLGRILAYTPKQ